MGKITGVIVKKCIKNHEKISDPSVRSKYGVLEGYVGIVGNIILFAVKLCLGIISGSAALMADAIHTLGDSVTSAVVIAGFIMAEKPSDKEHPFGHERMESIAALVIANLLFIAGFELALHSIKRITNPSISQAGYWVMAVIAVTLILKEVMSRFAYELGDMIDSDALKADAMHHRTDVAATGTVLVALLASRFDLYFIDGIMGVAVSGIIFYSAYIIFRDSVNILMGKAPSEETLRTIKTRALENPDVLGVHDIIYHQYGSRKVISIHIEVTDKKSSVEHHCVSEDVEMRIEKATGGTVTVHVDPLNIDHPRYAAVENEIAKIIADDTRISSFHDLRIVGIDDNCFNVLFELVPADCHDNKEKQIICNAVTEKLVGKFPGVKTVVSVAPDYAHS